MTITKRRVWKFECDQCGWGAVIKDKPRRVAIQLVRADGWDINRGNLADLCYACVDADGRGSALVGGTP